MRDDLLQLDFGSAFTRDLRPDPEPANRRRQVFGAHYSRVQPTPVAAPRLIAASDGCAALLGLSPAATALPSFTAAMAGNALAPGMDPHAACYGGHQFGHWAGQLGDGRAITLGDVCGPTGQRFELQLKGAGPTPYSRTADGRAVLRSSLREFVCSEAMHALGVPTTRALSLVATGEGVVRDMFYDGRPRVEPGAVVCRVAPSFVRFGNFELLAARGDHALLRELAGWVIGHHYPEIPGGREAGPEAVAAFFNALAESTAAMVVHWMRVGFVHGVMNTDNMSALGLTIDYGPYGWLEPFDPDWTPNTTDAAHGRYRFGQQPQVAMWNLAQLAHALSPLMDDHRPLEAGVGRFATAYREGHAAMLRAKLGLLEERPEEDAELVRALMRVLGRVETDYTLFFRGLMALDPGRVPDAESVLTALAPAFYDADSGRREIGAFTAWFAAWHTRRTAEGRGEDLAAAQTDAMATSNPLYVPRNWLAQEAIDAAEAGDDAPLHRWLDVLGTPYTPKTGAEHFAARRPEWARHRPGCSMLSCSS